MVEFFFYYNLKNESILQNLNNHNLIENSFLYVNNYNDLNNIDIHIDENENKLKLYGKYVKFYDLTLDDIIKKINNLNIGKKKKYKIIQQNCYLTTNNEKKLVYLII